MNILLIEDDKLLSEFIKKVLQNDGHFVQVESDGEKGFHSAQKKQYDVIILDIMLPHKDGISICAELRRQKIATPILILSAQTEEDYRVRGLDIGADDYLTKPFSHKELLARIRAITRRPSAVLQSELVVGDLSLSPDGHRVERAGKAIELSPKEYQLLEFLMRNQDTALPKHLILNKVWQIRSTAASNRLEVHVRHLREKVDKPFKKKVIHTVRGIGYKLSY